MLQPPAAAPAPLSTEFLASLQAGSLVDILDELNRWCNGVVLEVAADRYVTSHAAEHAMQCSPSAHAGAPSRVS
jgi:hypothetical protein